MEHVTNPSIFLTAFEDTRIYLVSREMYAMKHWCKEFKKVKKDNAKGVLMYVSRWES